MTDLEKQFAGNYVRLVNKSRSLEQRIILQDKIIGCLINSLKLHSMDCKICNLKHCEECKKNTYKSFEQIAQKQLVAEQNKKAADNASI